MISHVLFASNTWKHEITCCSHVGYLWMCCYNWLGFGIVLPNEVIAHFWQHAGLIAGTKSKKGHGVRCGWRLRGLYGPTEMI